MLKSPAITTGAGSSTSSASYASDEAAAQATQAALEEKGAKALLVRADNRNSAEIVAFFAAAQARFGPIYGVIANAGVEEVETPLADMSEEAFDRLSNINFKGTFLGLQQAARTVIDGGRIIAVASTIASYPPPGSAVYAATKAAVRLMAQVLSLEVGERAVTVNTLDPGAVDGAGIFTSMGEDQRRAFNTLSPLGRLPRSEDLVGAVEFLLSDQAAMINGHHLAVTGGFRL
ncbi:hypothetical protein LTR94_025398 [Friedmanniomyces endolithicus]|nr:hypothetical protein LTR94_025398 [Friedmanniomyces endolithicus]